MELAIPLISPAVQIIGDNLKINSVLEVQPHPENVNSQQTDINNIQEKRPKTSSNSMNNPVKQDNIVCRHKEMDNLIIIVTETKLKNAGHLDSGVTIIMNNSLAWHMCKVLEVPDQLPSIKLLFKNKLSVSILELYAGASLATVNESSFTILGRDFNKNGSHKCASFKKCFNLGLVNSLDGSVFKTIDYVFVFSSLVNAILNHKVVNVGDYFDTEYRAVSVSMGVGSFLNTHLFLLHKQANKDYWKYNYKSANNAKWIGFRKETVVNAIMFSDEFSVVVKSSDLDVMWYALHQVMCLSAKSVFKKIWFKSYDKVFNKVSSRFHKLELLVLKIIKAFCLVAYKEFGGFDSANASIRLAIDKRMESFELDKNHTIRTVLKYSFCKVVLDYLVVDDKLILEPAPVKSKIDEIMKSWTKNLWKEAWVSMIFKPYEWEGVLMNTYSIALIKMARKILSKILLDKISLACSTHNVLRSNNFLILRGITTQSSIFAIGLVIENVLEKDRKLWLVLQDMQKPYDLYLQESDQLSYNRFWFDQWLLSAQWTGPSGRAESQAGLFSFFAAGAFVDNTIWVGSSQTATQHILNVASEFFRLNNISINNDKTIAISINCRVAILFLTISGLFISIAKKRKPHHYLDKQCMYLVSVVLFPIISYRTQFSFIPLCVCNKWNALICKWSHHPLLFLACIGISPSNNFLADVVCIFFGCDLSLSGSLVCTFHHWSGIPMSLVLGELFFFKYVSLLRHYGIAFVEQLCDYNSNVFSWSTFKHWKRLDLCGPVFFWFDLSICFLGGIAPFSVSSLVSDIDTAHLFVHMDRSLCGLGTVNMKAGAAIFFEDIDMDLDIGVSGLVSFTLTKLQIIILALECVSSFRSVDLFSDSQAALDACMSESLLFHPEFRNYCWIKCRHIVNVIHRKNLDVNWIKIKSYLSILDNKHANALAKDAAASAWHLPYLVSECFLSADGIVVSGNFRHFVHDVFFMVDGLHADIDWFKSSLMWHSNSYLAAGFTTLYYWLPVAMCKHLYNRGYPSVVCLYCGNVEILDHVFSCPHDSTVHAHLLNSHALAWETFSASCVSEIEVGIALYKGFVFCDWCCESVSVFNDPKIKAKKIVNFVRNFCFAFWENVWLVCAKHWTFMEKHGLILHDSSTLMPIFGLPIRFSAGMIRLLGVAEAFGVSFGFCKFCSFFSGVKNLISVYIGM
ncbi:hypothetical protein G9A89_002945 [Geosiphon pyriformis]|nr:hypothetical protein G9A89_002945 [Geosiphon pyriformis]